MISKQQALFIYGCKLRKIINRKWKSESAFADSMGMGRDTLSHTLNGQNNGCMDSYFKAIEKLQCHPNDVFFITDEDIEEFLKNKDEDNPEKS